MERPSDEKTTTSHSDFEPDWKSALNFFEVTVALEVFKSGNTMQISINAAHWLVWWYLPKVCPAFVRFRPTNDNWSSMKILFVTLAYKETITGEKLISRNGYLNLLPDIPPIRSTVIQMHTISTDQGKIKIRNLAIIIIIQSETRLTVLVINIAMVAVPFKTLNGSTQWAAWISWLDKLAEIISFVWEGTR